MYLAWFFRSPTPGNDRKVLLILSEWAADDIVMTFRLTGDSEELSRADFASSRDAVAAFTREQRKLLAAGYVQTADTHYPQGQLAPDGTAKPGWQLAIDQALLAAIADSRKRQADLLAGLADTPANQQPIYHWLVGRQAADAEPPDPVAMRHHGETARALFEQGSPLQSDTYLWSMWSSELHARIYDLLCEAELIDGHADSGLAAAQRACDLSNNQFRSGRLAWILCSYFPHRSEEAFDLAWRYGRFGGFEAVKALPAYAAYAEARASNTKPAQPWRWGGRKEPASKAEIVAAERTLGATLPEDYRRFLQQEMRSELLIRVDDRNSRLRFYPARDLVQQRDNLVAYLTRTDLERREAENYFRSEYGVSLPHLLPAAEPAEESSCLLVHVAPGERHGWCYLWHHDDAFVLEQIGETFDDALAALTDAIERRDEATLRFFGIFVE